VSDSELLAGVVFAVDIAEIRLAVEHGTDTAAAATPSRATNAPAAVPATTTPVAAIRNQYLLRVIVCTGSSLKGLRFRNQTNSQPPQCT
jgi:hypothetical protein